MDKKTTLACLVCVLLSASVFAEPDNGKFLPSAEILVPNHVFLEAGGGLNFPVNFFNQGTIAMTSYGGNFVAGAGYNFSGWLNSITVTRDMWGQGKGDYALMENFKNNIVEFRLRKIISKKSIKWFPKHLEVIPGIGIGVNFITTDYYPSVRAKEEGRMNSVVLGAPGANCLFYRAGVELALNGITDLFIPFIGGDYNAFYDTSIGGGFAAGLRLLPLRQIPPPQGVRDPRKPGACRLGRVGSARQNIIRGTQALDRLPLPGCQARQRPGIQSGPQQLIVSGGQGRRVHKLLQQLPVALSHRARLLLHAGIFPDHTLPHRIKALLLRYVTFHGSRLPSPGERK